MEKRSKTVYFFRKKKSTEFLQIKKNSFTYKNPFNVNDIVLHLTTMIIMMIKIKNQDKKWGFEKVYLVFFSPFFKKEGESVQL